MSNSYLREDDVLFLCGTVVGDESRTYQVYEVLGIIEKFIKNRTSEEYIGKCLGEGGKGYYLSINGGGWQEGKIRLRFEFIPDQPKLEEQQEAALLLPGESESPLDDLRAELNLKNE